MCGLQFTHGIGRIPNVAGRLFVLAQKQDTQAARVHDLRCGSVVCGLGHRRDGPRALDVTFARGLLKTAHMPQE